MPPDRRALDEVVFDVLGLTSRRARGGVWGGGESRPRAAGEGEECVR